MKRIRVTITEEYLLPDDFEVLTHPEDHILCLHGNRRHFLPDLEWLERTADTPSADPEAAQRGDWQGVSEDRDDWFMTHCQTRATTIREMK